LPSVKKRVVLSEDGIQAVGADRPSASLLKIRNSGGRSTAALDFPELVAVT